jgi:hypothetical protein
VTDLVSDLYSHDEEVEKVVDEDDDSLADDEVVDEAEEVGNIL